MHECGDPFDSLDQSKDVGHSEGVTRTARNPWPMILVSDPLALGYQCRNHLDWEEMVQRRRQAPSRGDHVAVARPSVAWGEAPFEDIVAMLEVSLDEAKQPQGKRVQSRAAKCS